MNRTNSGYLIILILMMLIGLVISCSGRSGKPAASQPVSDNSVTEEPSVKFIRMVTPGEDMGCKLHNPVRISLETGKNSVPDSVRIWFDGQLVTTIKSAPYEFTVASSEITRTGRKSIKATAYRSKNKSQTITRFIVVYSDTKPKRNGFKVIHTYPHDAGAFTQGLIYADKIFYEGTGQPGLSNLRKVEPATGKVIVQVNLESPLFGEGIAITGEKIFQLTWQSKVGFVYDKSSLKQIGKIYYQTEGWGLTTLGNKLVMSDGTNIIYFREPDQFGVVSQIEVYDDEKKVEKLNELEIINGEIWANIWETSLIARIDPGSGKVISYIDLKGIISDSETDTSVNFLNGIAYDPETKRIFVTGKNWPKLFEISITE